VMPQITRERPEKKQGKKRQQNGLPHHSAEWFAMTEEIFNPRHCEPVPCTGVAIRPSFALTADASKLFL
ncbi:MAG: hypothetical protein RR281_02280, partial [Pseudoflavonifractor sp.]